MANNRTITAANSVYMLAIAGLFPVAQRLQGFAADTAFDTDAFNPSEIVMGIDGRMSAGWVPVAKTQSIMIMPDSESLDILDAWYEAQETAREIFFCDATIMLPAIERKYALTRGVLTNYKPIPDVRKSLQPVPFQITWQTISRSRI